MTTTEITQHAINLADTTIKAFNGDVASISITDGISLIDSWVNVLREQDQQANAVADSLTELKAELQSGSPDGSEVQQIIDRLIGQTGQVVNAIDSDDIKATTKANALVEALQSFSQQISGSSGSANTSEQAPMTSTVGGESTNSGVGTSALDSSDDSLSGRSGGTISNGPAPSVNQEDTSTITTERSSGTSGDDGSSNSSATKESRSDTGRVGGTGISGGTGDSDYSQSGGRSQY